MLGGVAVNVCSTLELDSTYEAGRGIWERGVFEVSHNKNEINAQLKEWYWWVTLNSTIIEAPAQATKIIVGKADFIFIYMSISFQSPF